LSLLTKSPQNIEISSLVRIAHPKKVYMCNIPSLQKEISTC